ncbi:EAL domain-containing protein [Yoonia sediminilitoris]|uniref:Amt family ammonium transporter n=1 Tax=Yoonia sediminilitoris TaxID=1286148 RepID=A0A2T6K8M3_9RHOB|nr:EAL domain-containing protein [Yoonia sediminilitoris]PUB11101.1 Amt family ammonium transporter [Yoonia sediminilitoris]RCW91020.1 Amt family ammonium transporter [Yoonia sediminilitoris]
MEILDVIWVLLCGFMVLDMQAGFLCLETGLSRAKSASNVALKNVSDICVTTLAFWGVGFGLMFGNSYHGLFGTSLFVPGGHSTIFDAAPFLFFQMAFATTVVTIVSGAVAERATFLSYLLVSAATAGLIYPITGHAIWGGIWSGGQEGWLQAMGFIDFAGASVVHSVGGWVALVYCVSLGPRRGRFGKKYRRFESSSIAVASLGVIFLWIGWAGFNAGSALAIDAAIGPIIVRTMLGAAAGGGTALVLSYAIFGFASANLTLNGVIAGLVAGTAGLNHFTGLDAILVGALGSIAMVIASFLMRAAKIDDVVDAVPVHLAPGILGSLTVPFFVSSSDLPAGTVSAQLQVQSIGVAAVALWTISMALLTIYLVNRITPIRVSPRQEVIGLDASEHSIGNAFLDLIEEMKRHQKTGSFNSRVFVERSTEVGMLAHRYNKVLDRVEKEISARIDAMQREKGMRKLAEESYTAMLAAQKESARSAREDRLTKLGNRLLLDEFVQADEKRPAGHLVVVAIDLDRFKGINDRHGHDAGDAVLVATAKRIRDVLRPGRDFAFRIGGDEFILLIDYSDCSGSPSEFCQDLCMQLTARVTYRHLQLEPGASIGIAVCHEQDTSLTRMLKQADMALYQAKTAGRGRVVAYTDQLGESYSSHVNELELFRNALSKNEIIAFAQTQVDAKTKQITGCEILARWRHPHRGIISPDQFIPLAEELNLVAELDQIILGQAIDLDAKLLAVGKPLGSISVNVSASRLASPTLLTELQARQDLPDGLVFEILETAHLDTLDVDVAQTVSDIKDLGIRIEIDDFGTGHASLASILALEPHALKIDGMFVPGIDTQPERAELMRSLISVAEQFGAETVVEGVETLEEAEVLAQLGADKLQGYAFSRPMSIQSLVEQMSGLKTFGT